MKNPFPYLLCLLAMVSVLVGCRSVSIDNPHLPTIYLEARGSGHQDQNPLVTLPISETKVQVPARPVFTPNDIIRIEIVQVDRGLAVRYLLTPNASRQLIRTTVDNIGSRFIFFNNVEPIGLRQIDGVINDGILYTFLEIPDEEIPDMVAEMNRTLIAYRRAQR